MSEEDERELPHKICGQHPKPGRDELFCKKDLKTIYICKSHPLLRGRTTHTLAKVIFTPKPGKTSYQIPNDNRPISQTNLLKGLDKLVVQEVNSTLESNPISDHQQGFWRCRSTKTTISSTINYMEKFYKNDKHCIAVFLDIAAAFNTIKPHIKERLKSKRVDKNIIKWYHGYITETHLTLEANDTQLKTVWILASRKEESALPNSGS